MIDDLAAPGANLSDSAGLGANPPPGGDAAKTSPDAPTVLVVDDEPSNVASIALHYKTSWLYYHNGNKTLGRQYIWRAIQKSPFHLKNWIGFILFEAFGSWGPRIHKQMSSWKPHLADS